MGGTLTVQPVPLVLVSVRFFVFGWGCWNGLVAGWSGWCTLLGPEGPGFPAPAASSEAAGVGAEAHGLSLGQCQASRFGVCGLVPIVC
jgi:hypothetical protein